MAKKLRELKSLLLKAGFTSRPGKGSHTVWSHPLLPGNLTMSGKDGNDAKSYQERDVKNAIHKVEQLKKEQKRKP